MQSRKRAKAVSFGKKPESKDHNGKEQQPHVDKHEEEAVKNLKPAEKAEQGPVPENNKQGDDGSQASTIVDISLSITKEPEQTDETHPKDELPASSNETEAAPSEASQIKEETQVAVEQPVIEESFAREASQIKEETQVTVEQPVVKESSVTEESQKSVEQSDDAKVEAPAGREAETVTVVSSKAEEQPPQPKEESDQTASSSVPTLGGDTYVVEKEVKTNMIGYFILIAVVSFVVGIVSMAAVSFFIPTTNLLAGLSLPAVGNPATPTPKPSNTPTPTPKKVDLADYSITILNGSGVTGAASKLEDSLTSAGFKVETVGNADTSDYTDTVVYAKKGVSKEYLTKLNDELEKMYTVSSESPSPTTASDEADVVITIGTNSASDLNP